MKKLVVFAVAALAMASAQAVTYWTLLVTEGVSSEVNGYKAYYCTKAQAGTFFEGADTYDKVAEYLTSSKENYDKGMGELTASTDRQLAQYDQTGSLAFYKYLESALSGEFIAVVAYKSESADANDQVRVFSASANGGTLAFDPASGQGSATEGWSTVPEPTSGMLLLLGFAALSLRRKRVVSC